MEQGGEKFTFSTNKGTFVHLHLECGEEGSVDHALIWDAKAKVIRPLSISLPLSATSTLPLVAVVVLLLFSYALPPFLSMPSALPIQLNWYV